MLLFCIARTLPCRPPSAALLPLPSLLSQRSSPSLSIFDQRARQRPSTTSLCGTRTFHTTMASAATSAANADPDHYGAIVLGSGQGGTPLTLSLARAGHRTLMVEATHIGGSKTCPFSSALPVLFACVLTTAFNLHPCSPPTNETNTAPFPIQHASTKAARPPKLWRPARG